MMPSVLALPIWAETALKDLALIGAGVTAAGLLGRSAWRAARKVIRWGVRVETALEDVPQLRADLRAVAAEVREEIATLRAENTAQHAASCERLDAIEAHITTPSRKRSA